MFGLRARTVLRTSCAIAAWLSIGAVERQAEPNTKPEVVLTALPSIAFAPARIKFTVTLKDGDDDYEEFYCASVEWDWDDGTVSQWKRDCDPYKAGRSRIQRHFSAVHTYDVPDDYRPTFRLKKREKVVAQVSADVGVQPGRPDQN
jgi:hypothetical protein